MGMWTGLAITAILLTGLCIYLIAIEILGLD